LSVDPKREKTIDIYTKERRKTPCRLPKLEPRAEYLCRALLLSMGADEADGGRRGRWGQTRPVGAGEADRGGKPSASCPSPPASQTKEATKPNP